MADMFFGKITGVAKVIGLDEQVVKTIVGTVPPLSAVNYLRQGRTGSPDRQKRPLPAPTPSPFLVQEGATSRAEAFIQFVLSQTDQ